MFLCNSAGNIPSNTKFLWANEEFILSLINTYHEINSFQKSEHDSGIHYELFIDSKFLYMKHLINFDIYQNLTVKFISD
jgi:hypothetical protein